MRLGTDFEDKHGRAGLDAASDDAFLEAQYRKTELRRTYADGEAADRVSSLMRSIEQEVIPRLVLAHRDDVVARQSPAATSKYDADWVSRFARSLLQSDSAVEPSAFIAQARGDGLSLEAICLDVLAPAARDVGTLWDDDQCTFFDVTVALGTLHRIMIALGDEFRFEPRHIDPARRILLVQASGGAHTFGLQMVADFFRRRAWTVEMAALPTNTRLSNAVQADWYTVIGFSVSGDPAVRDLAETIRVVRRKSLNPAVGILVGGPVFAEHPEYVKRVGADRMARDAIQAVIEAEHFVLQAA